MTGTSWVTLATNDSYSLGALVLAFSLKKVSTRHQLSVLVTPGVSDAMKVKLQSIFDVVKMVDPLDSKDTANLLLLKRPELGVTFTKLHCWTLTQFEKCVFLDADTLVLQNCDELFDREEFSAAPDVGWPDCFNSGVFVYRPSNETFASLIKFAEERGSFDGGDQGLLNLYFSGWAHTDISKHLPFIYNMCSTACYSYLPAFKQFSEGVKIIHFIGTAKPWMQHFDTETQTVYPSSEYNHLQAILQTWWNLFCTYIHPELSPEMAGLAGAFAQMTLGAPRTSAQSALEDHFRRQSWEIGNIDYMGRDSFANIWQKISSTLSTSAEDESPVETPLTATPSAKASGASASQQSAAAPKGSKTSTDAKKVSSPEIEERSDPQTSEANITLTETSRTPQRASPPKSKATKAKSDCAPPPKAASPPKSQHPKNSKSEHATPLPTAKSHPNPSDKPTQSQQPSNEKLTEPSPGIESYPSAAAPQKPKQQSPPKKSAKEQSKPKIKPEAQLPHTVEPSCQQPTSNKPHQKSQSPPQEQRPAPPPPPAPTSQLNQPENLSSGETVKKNKKPQKDAELQPSATAAPVKQQTPPESTLKPLPPVSKKHKKGHKEPPNPVVEPQPVTVEAAPPTPSKKNKKPQKEESQAVEQSTVPTSQCQKVQPPPPVQQTQQKPVETKSTTPQRDEACPQPPPRKDKKGGGAKKGNK